MNEPENQTYLDNYDLCIDQRYVGPILAFPVQALCFLLGTPALVWCLWISLSESLSGGLKPTLVFPINLFIVELVICIESLCEVINYAFLRHNVMLKQAMYLLFYLAWICRPLVQSCICVERYLAVAQPVAIFKYRLRRYRVVTITMAWALSLTYACISITIMGYKNTTFRMLIIVNCLGVVIISLCCFFILRVLNQPGPGEVGGGRGEEKKQGTTDPQKKRAFWIILTNLVIILLSSISVVVAWAGLPISLEYYCNVCPPLISISIFSVMASSLLHLHREGMLPCRRRPEAH